MIDPDELERLAKAAATEDDWGYAYDEFTDAWQPAVALEVLRELREAREANGTLRVQLDKAIAFESPNFRHPALDRAAEVLGGEGGK